MKPISKNAMQITWNTISPALQPDDKASQLVLQDAAAREKKLSGFLDSAARSGEPVLLIVNDPQRSTQTRPVLQAIAGLWSGHGVGTGTATRTPKFIALIATGTHTFPAHEREEFERVTFTSCGLQIQRVIWHDASDDDSLQSINGVRMNRAVVSTRFLLPIGSVEPHYFAGLTGPHKTLTIGCMSKADIERNHSGALDPASGILRLKGNPVHDDVATIIHGLEAAGKTICSIGQIVRGQTVVAAAIGNPLEILALLYPTVHQIYVHQVSKTVDVLFLLVPPPLDRSLYQADKALKNNHLAVRDGGGIILQAACGDGVGPDAFVRLLRDCSGYAASQNAVLKNGYHLGDHKAVKLQHLMDKAVRGVNVTLVTGSIKQSDLADTPIRVFTSVEGALDCLNTVVTPPPTEGLIVEDAGMVTVAPALP